MVQVDHQSLEVFQLLFSVDLLHLPAAKLPLLQRCALCVCVYVRETKKEGRKKRSNKQ